jgi:hypothetical protein
MMGRRLFAAAAAMALCVSVSGCGSKLYLNGNYQYGRPDRDVKLALIPAAGDDAAMLDSLFTLIFDDSTRSQILVEPSKIRSESSTDNELLVILNKIIAAEYSKDDLKSGANLQHTLAADEFALLRNRLGNPDIALIPVAMTMKSYGVMTSGLSKIRLFDLRNGSLIYENSIDLNVELCGQEGKVYLAIGLIGFAKDDFNRHFWNRFVGNTRFE